MKSANKIWLVLQCSFVTNLVCITASSIDNMYLHPYNTINLNIKIKSHLTYFYIEHKVLAAFPALINSKLCFFFSALAKRISQWIPFGFIRCKLVITITLIVWFILFDITATSFYRLWENRLITYNFTRRRRANY